jgi:hypothetical protein
MVTVAARWVSRASTSVQHLPRRDRFSPRAFLDLLAGA